MTARREPLTDAEFTSLLHHTEPSRASLAWAALGIGTIPLLAMLVASQGGLILVAAIVAGGIAVVHRLLRARLMGGAIKVGPASFPEIHQAALEATRRLAYDGKVEVYVIEEGSFNAKLAKFMGTRVILLHSDVVSRAYEDPAAVDDVQWIVARFVGALKARYRVKSLAMLMDAIRPLGFLTLFLLPFERATQYSGDQIGVAAVGDVRPALRAIHRLFVGRELGDRVTPAAVVRQGEALRTDPFGMLATVTSTHPHMTSRYLNMIDFAAARYPEGLAEYTASLDEADAAALAGYLALRPATVSG